MIQQYLRNKYYINKLDYRPPFNDTYGIIFDYKVEKCVDIGLPNSTSENKRSDANLSLIHDLTKSVRKLIHHVEHTLCKAS